MTIAIPSQGHAALRIGRVSLSRQIYFITVCCRQRQKYLQTHESARAAARTLHKLHVDQHVHLHAWVLMPDHMHLLIQLKEMQSFAACVGRINSCVAKASNQTLNRNGSVWQGAYFDRALRREEDLRTVILYLLNNPIRAGMVEAIDQYPYWDVTDCDLSVLDFD